MTFSAYHKLVGKVRLDSQHTGPEVRGVVSDKPSTDVTFSLDPRVLNPVQLTNRLWRLAAEEKENRSASDSTLKENRSASQSCSTLDGAGSGSKRLSGLSETPGSSLPLEETGQSDL